MPTAYTIKVINSSSNDQFYALFTEPPTIISGGIKPKIWSNVFARQGAAKTATTTFKITKQYYAVYGERSGNEEEGVYISVSGTKKVDLGYLKRDKTEEKGTSLSYVVKNTIPQFDDGIVENNGQVMAFQISTGEFDAAEAKRKNFVIGLAGSKTGLGPNSGPSAVFTPEPRVDYQIQPSAKYYLAFGDYTEGKVIDYVKKSKTALEIDFTELEKDGTLDVTVEHDKDNNLTILKNQD